MSKYVKNLICDDLRRRWQGVTDILLVSVAGMDTDKTYKLLKQMRAEKINLLVVKNSLARRAVEGTPLAPAFESAEGSLAVMWGGTDIVSLAKLATKLAEDKQMAPFGTRGGVMDGARLTAEQVKEVSKWPSREEVLAKLVGQILGPGSKLLAQIKGPGGTVVSQIKEKGKGAEEAAAGEPAPA